jgi:hypothetical protein
MTASKAFIRVGILNFFFVLLDLCGKESLDLLLEEE